MKLYQNLLLHTWLCHNLSSQKLYKFLDFLNKENEKGLLRLEALMKSLLFNQQAMQ